MCFKLPFLRWVLEYVKLSSHVFVYLKCLTAKHVFVPLARRTESIHGM